MWCEHFNETFAALLSHVTIYLVCSFNAWSLLMKSYGVTIQMKHLQQHFHMLLFTSYVVFNFWSLLMKSYGVTNHIKLSGGTFAKYVSLDVTKKEHWYHWSVVKGLVALTTAFFWFKGTASKQIFCAIVRGVEVNPLSWSGEVKYQQVITKGFNSTGLQR